MNEYSRNVTQIHLYTAKKGRPKDGRAKGSTLAKCKINARGRNGDSKKTGDIDGETLRPH